MSDTRSNSSEEEQRYADRINAYWMDGTGSRAFASVVRCKAAGVRFKVVSTLVRGLPKGPVVRCK